MSEDERAEYPTMADAAQAADRKAGTVAVRLRGRGLALSRAEAEALAASGRPFAYLHIRHGVLVTVPVNQV